MTRREETSTRCSVLFLKFHFLLIGNVNKMSCFASCFLFGTSNTSFTFRKCQLDVAFCFFFVFETFPVFQSKCQQDVVFYFLFSFWHWKHKFHFQEMSTRYPVLFLLLFLKLSLSFRVNVNKMSCFTSCFLFGTSDTTLSLLIKHNRFYRRGEFRGSWEEPASSHEWQQILLARLNRFRFSEGFQ